MHKEESIRVSVRHVVEVLLVVVLALHTINIAAQYFFLNTSDGGGTFATLFTVNNEGRIPTWYSAASLLLCCGLLVMVGLCTRHAVRGDRLRWLVLAIMFAAASVDEAAAVHDDLSMMMGTVFPTGGMLRNAWVIPAMALAAGLGVYLFPLLRRLPNTTRRGCLLAAGLYLGGTIGMEMINALYVERFGNLTSGYAAMASIEELLEMSGIVLFIFVMSQYLGANESKIMINASWTRRVFLGMLGLVTILAVLGFAVQISRYVLDHGRLLGAVRWFDLDMEGNVPSWFSSMSLLACAGLLAVIAIADRGRTSRRSGSWGVLAVLFLYISLDEFAGLHELLIVPLRHALNAEGMLHFTWVVPGGLFVLALAVIYLRFFLRLPGPTRIGCAVAATLYVGGALGMELFSGLHAFRAGQENLTYQFLIMAEEIPEMLGVTVFLRTLIQYIGLEFGAISLRLLPSGAPTTQSLPVFHS